MQSELPGLYGIREMADALGISYGMLYNRVKCGPPKGVPSWSFVTTKGTPMWTQEELDWARAHPFPKRAERPWWFDIGSPSTSTREFFDERNIRLASYLLGPRVPRPLYTNLIDPDKSHHELHPGAWMGSAVRYYPPKEER